MDLLFRLSKSGKTFLDHDDVHRYFTEELPNRDDGCFFDVNKKRQIKAGDKYYFVYDGYIVAVATFLGLPIIEDRVRDEEFIYGHRVHEVELINSQIKIDISIFGTRTTYINSDEKRQELERILKQ